ncbi:MAG TPA: hypothetical protein VLJ60_02430, partial [bacterium]|nr:hypothetical protein [bacterium]
MRNILIIFLLLSFWSCTSCNGNSRNHDSDDLPDLHDYDKMDADLPDDLSDEALAESEVSTESEDADIDDEWERDIEMPDMSENPYWEEYSDSDKNIAYYYYGDKPVKASDPEDVKALWSKMCSMTKCYECEAAPYDLCAENYPFEAQIINGPNSGSRVESTAGEFQCDALLTPGKWYTTEISNSVQFSEIDGSVLYYINNGTASWQGGGAFAYDMTTRKVERIGRGYMDGWQNKKYYFISTYDHRIDIFHEESLYYGPKQRQFLYYDKVDNKYGYALKFAETPTELVDVRASETYLFMSAHFKVDASDMRILYTKIGEWDKWKELTYKKDTLYGGQRRAGYPSMIDNFVVYFDYDIQVQFCDLSKGDAGCFKVSRSDEYGRYPIFKDKNTVIYSSQKISGTGRSLVQADITDKNSIKYQTLYEWSELNSIQAGDVDDKKLLFMRKYSNGGEEDVKDVCFYRFSDKKVVCMDESFDLKFVKDDGYIYNNYYVFRSRLDLVVRDLECYCDFYPAKCPLS